jgi:hypothetical protein
MSLTGGVGADWGVFQSITMDANIDIESLFSLADKAGACFRESTDSNGIGCGKRDELPPLVHPPNRSQVRLRR